MKIYYTYPTPPRHHTPTFDELLFANDEDVQTDIYIDPTSTTTRTFDSLSPKLAGRVDLYGLLNELKDFNARYQRLAGVLSDWEDIPATVPIQLPRKSGGYRVFDAPNPDKEHHPLYDSFSIPKKSGGLRQIDAPVDELKESLYELKDILEKYCLATYHTTAFAYIKDRCTIDSLKKHQANDSRWYLKLDCKNFFPNTSLDFVMNQLSMIYPFCELCKWTDGKDELRKALSLGFLRGGLPQGTPLSPLITNLMMIPIDHELNRTLNQFHKQHFVYTRYADDILISSYYDFNYRNVERMVSNTFKDFNAPFWLNQEKTRYGNRNGSNWNLGLMINKDNEITIGYKQKKRFRAMINNFTQDFLHGNCWSLGDMKTFEGLINYYHMVEPKYTNDIIARHSEKYHVNIMKTLKAEIKKACSLAFA